MKSSELRIGNWINIIGLVPTQATSWHIKAIDDGDDQYSAIPLTEEWLVKFGFRNEKIPVNGNSWHLKCSEGWAKIEGDYEYMPIIHKVEYVHQLQNLYFALTGEELEIK